MAKLDLSKMIKDLNLEGVVSNVKSMINPEGGINPEEMGDDPINKRIAEVHVLSQALSKSSSDMTKQLNTLNSSLEGLYKELQAMKGETPKAEAKPEAEKAPEPEVEAPKAEEPKEE